MMNSPNAPRLPCSAPTQRRRPSDVLPRKFNGGETPPFVRFPFSLKCSSSAVASPSSAVDSRSLSPSSSSSAPPPSSSSTSSYTAGIVAADARSSSFPSSDSRLKYDVFMSFRGPDTREKFVSHLYKALSEEGLETFIDSEELDPGEEITPTLLDAIDRSRISIVVFSKKYASSRWCLDELAKIMECRRTRGHEVLPVFYDVEPTEVRRQSGSYEVAFAKYEKATEGSELVEKVVRWRNALTAVANLSGFDSSAIQSDSLLVDEIVNCAREKLERLSFHEDEGLIGMYPQVKEVEELLENRLDDVRSVGIWGTGGIGKTGIAGAIFNRQYRQFDSYCFLANIREECERHGLTSLRNELLRQILDEADINIATPDIGSRILRDRLRRKRVLIVLDDLSNRSQLDFLIKDSTYFGPGSRIIITTRDRDVVKDVDEIYSVKGLAESDALELFSHYAFKQNYPPEDYLQLSRNVVAYAKRIPLVVKVLGSFLCKRSVVGWESALRRFQSSLHEDIYNILRVSYDGLNDEEREIFLDAACFFKGEVRSSLTNFLDGCGISAEIGIQSLTEKCLISCSGDRLQIDELLQNMARQIVLQESTLPSRRSRLWNYEDVHQVLTGNMGVEYIKGISLDLSEKEDIRLSPQIFARFSNLRFLRFNSSSNGEKCQLHLPEGLEYLPRNLRFLHWDSYPLRTLPVQFPQNLVELCMHNSRLEHLWEGVQTLHSLRSLDISHSISLKKLPDLSNAPRLQRIVAIGCPNLVSIPTTENKLQSLELLDLSGCSNLKEFPEISWNVNILRLADSGIEEIPPSIENFNRLAVLDMKNCKMLKYVPNVIQKLEKLEFLDLSGCSNVTSFPVISSNLEMCLLNETAVEEIPPSIKCMEKLELLELKNCSRLKILPSSICKLKSLVELNLSGSSNFSCFPEILETMDRLNYLSLDGTGTRELPNSLENLTGLYSLDLQNCRNLVSLPDGLSKMKLLEDLNLNGCSNLESLPQGLGNLESLRRVRACGCKSQIVDFLVGSIPSLQILHISDCGITEFPDALTLLPSLTELDMSGNYIKRIPSSIKHVHALQFLNLSYCQELESLSGLPAGLTSLIVLNCRSLEMVALSESSELQLYPLNNVETYVFANCPKLSQHSVDNMKAFAKRRIHVLASNVGVILNFRSSLSHNGWLTPQQMRYLLCSMYNYGNFHEALRGLYKSFFSDEPNSEEPLSSLFPRMLHDFHERCGLDTQGLLGFFSLVAHLYFYYQGKPSTNFCLPEDEIPEWFCHQSDGSSIAIMVEPPKHSNERSILAGFAVSVLVAFSDYSDDKGIDIKYEYHFRSNHCGPRGGAGYLRGWDGQMGKPLSVEGDHLFLSYDSSLLFDAAKGMNDFVGYSQELVEVSLKFHVVDGDGNPTNFCMVKKCAIQPLYISDTTKSEKEPLCGQDVTKGLTKSFSGYFPKVLRNLDLFGAVSLGILNVLGDLSVDVVHQGGYVNIIMNCENAGLLIGRQILNVHLGVAPLSVKLIELPQHSQDHRAVSIEFSDVDGEDSCHRYKVKKCEIRPLDNHVMLIDRCGVT